MSEHADRYATVAAGFTRRVEAVAPGAWDNPAPCEGWVARDVVSHLVEWIPAFFFPQWDVVAHPTPPHGPRVEVPADADEQTKLLAFIGRAQ